jgi:Fe-S-cluster containining protein
MKKAKNEIKNKCVRCGKCCQHLTFNKSPKQLKEEYNEWFNSIKIKGNYTRDIFLIYPMLKYKKYNKKVKRYIYECKHLKFVKNKAMCTIQDIKPRMCSIFPLYTRNSNPSQYKGCGYNKDKNSGIEFKGE